MNDKLESMWKGRGRDQILRQYSLTCLEGLRKTTKTLNQDSRVSGPIFEPWPTEYGAGVLTTQPRS
jgi:hypothetical protein